MISSRKRRVLVLGTAALVVVRRGQPANEEKSQVGVERLLGAVFAGGNPQCDETLYAAGILWSREETSRSALDPWHPIFNLNLFRAVRSS